VVTRKWTARPSGRGVRRRLFVQVTLPIAGVGALLLAIGVYGAWRVHRLHKRGADIVAENVTGIRNAEQLHAAIQELRHRLKRFASIGDERHLEEISRLLPKVREQHGQIHPRSPNAAAARLVGQIRSGVDEFSAAFARLRAETDAPARREEAIALADSSVPGNILGALEDYVALNDEQVDRSSQRNQATANRLMFGLLLLGTCGGVAGLFLGYAIARRVGRTIVEVAVCLRDVAGKLDQAVGPVAVTANPSVQDLEAVLQIISQRVSTVVERLQASEREALRAEQLASMGQLAAGLAHEIRNPLTSMKTIVQLAEGPSDLTTQDIRILDEEIARLEQSVQTFLDYARPAHADKRRMPLREVLEQPAALVSRRAARQGIDFVYQPPDSALRVAVDAVQIRQVLLNLLLNAFEATPAGGTVRLEAAAERFDNANFPEVADGHPGALRPRVNCVCIRVVDSGSGLPGHLGSRIFDPFVSTKDTGTGLGLSICRRIVEDHGGRIVAENRPQGGAVLAVRLPPAPSEPGPACNAASGDVKATLESAAGDGRPLRAAGAK
jgi:two-component system, NtrC family, sensor histidine kinase HydH